MDFLKRLQAKRTERKAKRKFAAYEKRHKRSEPSERPAPLPVEETFDAFVKDFGGEKISDGIGSKSQMPLNADYIFREHNVIAELKTLEGIFSGPTASEALFQAFTDAGHPPTDLVGVIFRGEALPEKVQSLVRTRIRRGLEQRVKAARKQLRLSKSMFGNDETFTLILIAMDQSPMFGHRFMLGQLAALMGSNYADEHTDGIIYFNPNMPTRVEPDGMEYAGWFPIYRDEQVNEKLSTFVNLLGNRWLTHFGALIGEEHPILELESSEEMLIGLR